VRGLKERLKPAVCGGDHDHLPHLDNAGEDQDGQQRLQEPACRVGDDHDPLPR
jgi:hypothetical protein